MSIYTLTAVAQPDCLTDLDGGDAFWYNDSITLDPGQNSNLLVSSKITSIYPDQILSIDGIIISIADTTCTLNEVLGTLVQLYDLSGGGTVGDLNFAGFLGNGDLSVGDFAYQWGLNPEYLKDIVISNNLGICIKIASGENNLSASGSFASVTANIQYTFNHDLPRKLLNIQQYLY